MIKANLEFRCNECQTYNTNKRHLEKSAGRIWNGPLQAEQSLLQKSCQRHSLTEWHS